MEQLRDSWLRLIGTSSDSCWLKPSLKLHCALQHLLQLFHRVDRTLEPHHRKYLALLHYHSGHHFCSMSLIIIIILVSLKQSLSTQHSMILKDKNTRDHSAWNIGNGDPTDEVCIPQWTDSWPRTIGPADYWAHDNWAHRQLSPGQFGPGQLGPNN